MFKTQIVEITTADNPQAWYADKIGERFEVYRGAMEMPQLGSVFLVYGGGFIKYIREDCCAVIQ